MGINGDPGLRAAIGEMCERLGNDPDGMTDTELVVQALVLNARATVRATEILVEMREALRDISGASS